MMNYRVTYSDELYHHGILGQKWGKKNGPPYPLDADDHSASEKKAGWRKSLAERSAKRKQRAIEKSSKKLQQAKADYADLNKNGINSAKFKRDWGDFGDREDIFKFNWGISRAEALKRSKKSTKNKLVRASYKAKIAKGADLTDEERALKKKDQIKKAILIAGVTALTVGVAYKMLHDKEVDAGLLDKYLDADLKKGDLEDVIKEGFEFHRMTGWKKEDWSGLNRLYVSATNIDRDIYKGFLRDWHHTGERFEHTLRAAKDIKVAGSNKQLEVFEKMLEDNDFFDEFADKFSVGYRQLKTLADKDYAKERILLYIGDGTIEGFAKKYYDTMIYDLVKTDSSTAKKYLQQLKDLGYDAVVDDFDRGKMSYKPLIIINPEDVLEQVGATKVTQIDEAKAQERLFKSGLLEVGFKGLKLHDIKEFRTFRS